MSNARCDLRSGFLGTVALILGVALATPFALLAHAQQGDDSFPRFDGDFAQWRVTLHDWLSQHSLPQRTDDAVELNLPFERSAEPSSPYRGRFLLLHGLNDSPYVWHDFADELTARGFDVRAVLFEGHGSSPEHMLDVHWESWLRSARRHLSDFQRPGEALHIGGFSMGGVLASLLALDNPQIDSLFLISPAFDSKLNNYLRFSGLYKLFRPWVFGGMILEDNPIKYNSIPVNSGWQFFELTRALKRRWQRGIEIETPTLMVLTEDDSVVDTDYTERVFRRRFVNKSSRLIRYAASAVLDEAGQSAFTPDDNADGPRSSDRDQSDERIVTRDSRFPEYRILNQSHLGLMYAPDNPLFGRNADVLVCNGNEYPVFMACMRSSRHWFGAQHTESPDDIPVARTTWNPDWSAVLHYFDRLHGIEVDERSRCCQSANSR